MKHGTISGATYTKHEDERQKLRMAGGAWSINLEEITKDIRFIRYITNKGIYVISVKKAKEEGFEAMLGGEWKLVVPIKRWLFLKHGQ